MVPSATRALLKKVTGKMCCYTANALPRTANALPRTANALPRTANALPRTAKALHRTAKVLPRVEKGDRQDVLSLNVFFKCRAVRFYPSHLSSSLQAMPFSRQ